MGNPRLRTLQLLTGIPKGFSSVLRQSGGSHVHTAAIHIIKICAETRPSATKRVT
jgi:hypothetical protein